jgi:hypothetical protein
LVAGLSPATKKGINNMYFVTHFRTEFIHQGQAYILRKVTMTQFMLVIIMTALGVGLFKAPFWLAPLFIAAGYIAGHTYNGEVLAKRIIAYFVVRGRTLTGSPQIVNLQAEWEDARLAAEKRQAIPAMVP